MTTGENSPFQSLVLAIPGHQASRPSKGMVWADTLGLSVFGVVGCHVAIEFGSPWFIAIIMGMVTATGGGLIRDVITNTQPMIVSGQIYATASLLGSVSYAGIRFLGFHEISAEVIACLLAVTRLRSEHRSAHAAVPECSREDQSKRGSTVEPRRPSPLLA